jgi:hypothetical protein
MIGLTTPGMAFRTENGGKVVSAGHFPPDLFRTIDPCHGSIVRKNSAPQVDGETKSDNKPTRPWWMIVVCVLLAPEVEPGMYV